MGPAVALKAAAGSSFSLLIFGISQVAMDLQPLFYLLSGEGPKHGFSHTFLGGTLIALVSALIGRPLCHLLLDRWNPAPTDRFATWLRGPRRISWPVAVTTAFIGTYSHVLLDSLVHPDVQPFAPFSSSSPLLGAVSLGELELLCVGVGILGVLGFGVRYFVESGTA